MFKFQSITVNIDLKGHCLLEGKGLSLEKFQFAIFLILLLSTKWIYLKILVIWEFGQNFFTVSLSYFKIFGEIFLILHGFCSIVICIEFEVKNMS